ncbi:MAG: hypothetical protein P4L33_04180 [Capsulimonadaceae bacterium]|nr:hypothetical protein [Capsulimonadaceae bacterium]
MQLFLICALLALSTLAARSDTTKLEQALNQPGVTVHVDRYSAAVLVSKDVWKLGDVTCVVAKSTDKGALSADGLEIYAKQTFRDMSFLETKVYVDDEDVPKLADQFAAMLDAYDRSKRNPADYSTSTFTTASGLKLTTVHNGKNDPECTVELNGLWTIDVPLKNQQSVQHLIDGLKVGENWLSTHK